MTAQTRVEQDHSLDPQLADVITEAVVWASDGAERAEVLFDIIRCAVEALHWRLEPAGDPHEERSAGQVLDAAAQHVGRMCS